MNGNNVVYWDACIFIAFLKNEQRTNPLDMIGISEMVLLIDNGDLDLVTSTISFTEVLESTIPRDAYDKFLALFGRRNIHLVEVTKEIALISHELRNFYKIQNDGFPTLTTPDALHIATAIRYGCGIFYTFDENDEKNKRRALLPLAQPLIGKYQLSLVKPSPKAKQLFMDLTSDL